MKNCLFCKHFIFEPEKVGYSEYTPGSAFHMYCTKGVWDETDLFKKDIRDLLSNASKCKDYTKDPWVVTNYNNLIGE